MAKQTDNSIIISPPRQGLGQSPHVGFGAIVNLDIDRLPGIAQMNTTTTKLSSTTITGLPLWQVRNPLNSSEAYSLDADGKFYKEDVDTGTFTLISGNVTTSASGNGLQIWKDYAFIARDATLDTYGPLAGAIFTVTIASPAVFSKTAHGLVANDTIIFSTTGALPTGLTAGTVYYVIAAGLTADAFEVSTSQGGAAVNTSGSQSGTHTYRAWKSTNSFKTIDSDVDWHPMITSKNDNKLYGGAGNYIFSLDEVSGQTFNPGTSATFTWTQQALDLPSSYRIKCLEELGSYLMAGTWWGTLVTDFPVADIFPWDRSSVSFGQPISLKDFGVHAMINTGSELVVLAGVSGTIYGCNGASAYVIGKVPGVILSGGRSLFYYPGAIAYWRGKVYFGVGTGGSGATSCLIGVYSLRQTGQGNILNLEYLNSQLTDGSVANVDISSLLVIGRNSLQIGWRSDTSYGIDSSTASSYNHTTDYSAYFETPLYIVADNEELNRFTKIKILFAKNLASGEGVRVKFRTNLSDSFTVLSDKNNGVYTYATLGAVSSHVTTPGIDDCEMLQLRVEFLGSSSTTPQLKQIKIC